MNRLAAAAALLLFWGCSASPDEVVSASQPPSPTPARETGVASADAASLIAGVLGEPQASILVLGTFHFKDAGLDDYKPEHEIDILSAERQAEVEEIVGRLARYRPTKVAVEWRPEFQERIDERYAQYLHGELELGSNEVYQLGFRLAKRLGHDRVYLVDAPARAYEPWVDVDEYAVSHGQEELIEGPWGARYQELYRAKDALKMTQTLAEHLLFLNSDAAIRASHGAYLVGGFEVGVGEEYPGADNRTRWYNRNLRIFANLQRITEREDERILLIIGAGHLSILRHAIDASPVYRLVEPAGYLE